LDFGADDLRERSRAAWALGDYAVIAERITAAAEVLVERTGVEPGMDVLDVATGTGNAALPAVQRGARVTGLDLVPELLDVARERAADLGFEVDWVEGDAQDLPFEGARFDRVLSAFGHMFAPRHERAAGELVRVCRPGGVIGFCCWTPEGVGGRLFAAIGSYLPPAPPYASSPSLWGSEAHVRKLLGDNVASLEFERHAITFAEESLEAWLGVLEESIGPLISIREELGDRWPKLRADLVRLFEGANTAEDGSLRIEQEYLLTIARL
jgi:ubiquinone/menaquinone biosynthesis C-methylase UbiE